MQLLHFGGLFVKIKIKEFATVQMGYSFRSRLEVSENGNISVIQMKDLLDDNTVECKKLTKIDVQKIKIHHLVKNGDLVFRSRGLNTTSAIILENPGKTIVAAPLLRIRITDSKIVLPEYLNWFITQREAQSHFTSRAKGSTQKMITKEVIENLEVYLPSLNNQKKIIKLDSLANREISLLQTLAEKKKLYISTKLMQLAKGE